MQRRSRRIAAGGLNRFHLYHHVMVGLQIRKGIAVEYFIGA